MGDWEGKPNKRLNNKKLLELNEKIWEENQNIIEYRYCPWKNLLILTRIKKEKLEDYVKFANRKIDEKLLNPMGIEGENQS